MGNGRKYEHDLFISYAGADDTEQIPGDPDSRWVTYFVKSLRNKLDRTFVGERSVNIWHDVEDLEGADHHDKVFGGVKNSALFLIILSSAYLDRPWCLEERKVFRATAGEDEFLDRIRVVRVEPLADERVPGDLKDLQGFDFFKKDGSFVTRFGDPPKKDTETEYLRGLNRLFHDLKEGIEKLNRTPPKAEGRKKVFLAESHCALRTARLGVSHRLQDEGYLVLPDRSYDYTPEAFRSAIDADLEDEDVKLFVQMLGEEPGKLDEVQWAAAQAAAEKSRLNCLRWRPKDAMTNPDFREFLEAPDIVRQDLEDFKNLVIERLCKQARTAELPGQGSASRRRSVLVNYNEDDIELAGKVSERLDGYEFDSEFLPGEVDLMEAATSVEYDGVLVVFNAQTMSFARDQLRSMKTLAMREAGSAPALGTFKEAPLVPLKWEGLHILPDHWDEFSNQCRLDRQIA